MYKVTIEDEKGNIVHQVESDCIMAAISNPKENGIIGALMTSCNTITIAGAIATLNKIKEQAYESNPILILTELSEMLSKQGKSEEKTSEKEVSDFLNKLLNCK